MPFLGKTPTKFLDANVNIDGGNIDGTTIGATSAASATVTTFTSTGIDDNATSTAITIDSSENVGIGESSPSTYGKLVIKNDTASGASTSAASSIWLLNTDTTANNASTIFFGDNGISAAGAINFINTDHTSEYGAISFDTRGSSGYAERMRIDSSGRFLVGTTDTPSSSNVKQVLAKTGDCYLQIASGTTGGGLLGQNGANMLFYTYTGAVGSESYAERMRIDSSGNLLVGKTSTDNTTNGFVLDANGTLNVVRSSEYLMRLNRTSTDGEILRFQRDGISVGSLSAHGGAVNIGNGIASLAFLPSLNTIHPNGTGSGSDGLTSLGWSNNRFKDLYLSGKLTNNGTGGINIDTSGRVGIGVTPDAWRTTDSVLQLGTQTSVAGLANDTHFSNNAYFDTGSTWKAQNTAQATNYYQSSGIHVWRYAGTTTADTAISWSEAMRIDSSGKVGIGTSTMGGAIGSLLTLNGTSSSYTQFNAGTSGGGAVGTEGNGLVFYGYSGNLGSETYTKHMTLDSSGNVGIGTTSPLGSATERTVHVASSATNTYATMYVTNSNNSVRGYIGVDGNLTQVTLGTQTNHNLLFQTNNTERVRIDTSGNLLVATSSGISASAGKLQIVGGSSTTNAMGIKASASGTAYLAGFYNTSGGAVGYISTDGSSTTYGTSSDYRLKENIVDAPAGNIDDIRVRSFDWKADGSHQTYGMVAQELVDVAPEAVTQGATDDDMWGVDYSKLVPMMIKEIQDLRARVAQLEGA